MSKAKKYLIWAHAGLPEGWFLASEEAIWSDAVGAWARLVDQYGADNVFCTESIPLRIQDGRIHYTYQGIDIVSPAMPCLTSISTEE